jgi:acetoin utilization protein AcuC
MPSVIHHPAYGRYGFGEGHPFHPRRAEMVLDLLTALGHEVRTVAPEPCSREQLLGIHEEYYVRRVEELGEGAEVPDREEYGLGTQDVPVFDGMGEAARWLVGGTLHGARLVTEGERRVLQLGGGLHHARRNFASGFCLYNDLAVAIRWLVERGYWVAYLDIDVHHGDGVQQIFYEDKRVMTVSLHESGQYLFPGSGAIHELGSGVGRGLKLNVPLEPFTTGESYLEVLDEVVPAALRHFRPAVLVVQSGADAHFDDPLADLLLSTRDYEAVFRRILEWAALYTAGRVLFTLGGGYSLRAAPRVWALLYLVLHDLPIPDRIPERWRRRWAEVIGAEPPHTLHDADGARPEPPGPPSAEGSPPAPSEIARRNRQTARQLLAAARPYWL